MKTFNQWLEAINMAGFDDSDIHDMADFEDAMKQGGRTTSASDLSQTVAELLQRVEKIEQILYQKQPQMSYQRPTQQSQPQLQQQPADRTQAGIRAS